MALTFHTFKYLEKLKKENFFFGETLSLGRLNNLINKDDFKTLKISVSSDDYADNILFENFNLKSLKSLDFSKFENADIICNLNEPIEKDGHLKILIFVYYRVKNETKNHIRL